MSVYEPSEQEREMAARGLTGYPIPKPQPVVDRLHQHGPYIVTEWEYQYGQAEYPVGGGTYHFKDNAILSRQASRVRCANCLEEREL